MLKIPSQVLLDALEARERPGGALAVVLAWWEGARPAGFGLADHVGVYFESKHGLWYGASGEEPDPRTYGDFDAGESSAICGDILIEFRRTERKDGYDVAYDFRGDAILSVRAEPGLLVHWAEQDIGRIPNRLRGAAR